MIGFDKTITVYNKRFDLTTKQTLWPKTVVAGVSWSGGQKVAVSEGLTSNDGYSVRVPLAAMPDGLTAQNGDVVMRGEGPDVVADITEITKRFTDCFAVTAVNTANLARLLPHLHLEGK